MEQNRHNPPTDRVSQKVILIFTAGVAIALIVLVGALYFNNRAAPATAATPAASDAWPAEIASAAPQQVSPPPAVTYHKKVALYKRTLAESDLAAVRSSADSSGYQALAVIPPAIVAPHISIRTPQFLSSAELNNYQALSTLGTQNYFSNANVQELLSSLSRQALQNNLSYQQYVRDLNFQQTMNTINTQQYLNNLNFQLSEQNLNFQQYLSNLNTQMQMNNLNNQAYLNNFNLNNQSYMNNFNTFSSPTYKPNFYTPQVHIYTPPVQFYNPPVFYNPPSFNNFP